MDESRRAELINKICEAFRNVTQRGVTLHEARAIDNYSSDEDRIAVRRLDSESDWNDIAVDKLRKFAADAVFLDAAGALFYLPAFMVAALRGPDVEILQNVLLNLRSSPMLHARKLMSESQVFAVCEFLRVFADDPWAEDALASWEKSVTD